MISILMPIYNGIEYISESIESVLNQSVTCWELLIGINGHPKNSDVYKKALEYKSEKVSIFDFYNLKGKSVTLNELLKYAKYDIVCLLDVDDKWGLNKLYSQMCLVHRYDVIGTNCKYFGNSSLTPNLHLGSLKEIYFRRTNTIINSSVMIVRRGRYLYWDSKWDGVEDYELWIRLLRRGWSFFNISDILIWHRIHKDSFFNNNNKNLSEKLARERFK
jgi:teichuronic acid biosynthesis glycosyltransferase TuaG